MSRATSGLACFAFYFCFLESVFSFSTPFDFEKSFVFDLRQQNSDWKAHTKEALESLVFSSRKDYVTQLKFNHPNWVIDLHPMMGSGHFVRSLDGNLSSLPEGDVLQALKNFIEDHDLLFGIKSQHWPSFSLIQDASEAGGARYLIYQQNFDSYPILDAFLRVAISASGHLISISSLSLNLDDLDVNEFPEQISEPAMSFKEIHFARQVYFPKTALKLIPALEIYYDLANDQRTYRGIFSASTGELLFRESMTHFSLPPSAPTAEFLVFAESLTSVDIPDHEFRFRPMDSPQPVTPGPSEPNYFGENEPPYSNQFVVFPWVNSVASPLGWLGEDSLSGNNVKIYRDWDSNSIADPEFEDVRPNEFGDYLFSINFNEPLTAIENLKATHVQAAYTANWFHDRLYEAGFTEAFANFQVDNFDRGGIGGDPIEIITQQGYLLDQFNLALFSGIPLDGFFGRVKLGLFTGSGELRDPAIDSTVVMHELTHAVTRRLLPLNGWQGDGLNEGWADFIALSLVAFEDDGAEANYPIGSYISKNIIEPASDSFYFGARRFPYSANIEVSPLTFEDIDPDRFDVDSSIPMNPLSYQNPLLPHNVGEVWAAMLWEVRNQILNQIDFEEAQRVILKLFVESLKLAPTFPDFIQMRDALILADQLVFAESYRCALWRGFAKRGLGLEAALGLSGFSIEVAEESYEFPEDCIESGEQPGDFNNDGYIDGADLGILLGSWGSINSVVDLNDDGLIDGADLGIFLGLWSA